MNKLAVVFGVAAVATITGCKDPEYARITPSAQNEAKSVETEAAPEEAKENKPEEVQAEEIKEEAPKCKCAPGTKHDKPCACGADDCQCVVETKPVEPEYTVYIVQRGDYLAKISKKFNITINSIKKLNNMKTDSVRLGQKLKLPGKVDVGEQSVPEGAVKKAPAKKGYESYKGETVEYVVKSGDTLGGIAYSHGMNIRQLKELNGLSKDVVRVGQKLKVAANSKNDEKPATAKPTPKAQKSVEKPVETEKSAEAESQPTGAEKPAEPVPAEEPKADAPAAAVESAPAAEDDAAPAADTTTYVVLEGDTLPRIAIDFEVPVARIRELNNLGEGDEVKAGQVLKIPAAQ